jgi:hypothetical protein
MGGKGGSQGVFGKTALSFPFLGPEQRREGEAALGCRPAAIAGEPGHVDGWEVGEMEMAMRGIDSDPHLGSGRREEAAPQAAADWRWR